MVDKIADFLFEVSWEVCNKVGGIYTVVKSKARSLVSFYGKSYMLIGPYFVKKAAGEFVESLPPEELKQAFDKLKNEGIECHFGEWLIDGTPSVILVDFTNFTGRKNEIKTNLWNDYRIDSINTQYFDFDEPVIWATAVGKLLDEISKVYKDRKIVAQFHEWLAGAGLLYLKKKNASIATIFTTHATMLGRTLAAANVELYDVLDKIDPEKEAYKYGIQAKYQTEKTSAQNAEIFTTVSEITALEAEKLLKRKPDVICPNGLDIEKFPTFEELTVKHRFFKKKLKEFLLYYFFPYHTFDLTKTVFFFICGRYEFRDKGIDVFIKALGELNKRLKAEKSEHTVVAFLWIPGNIKAIKPSLLENKTLYQDIVDSVDENMDTVRTQIIHSLIARNEISKEVLFTEEVLNELKVKVLKFLKKGKPPVSTHDLYNEEQDQILQYFAKSGLNNEADDKVKVVYYSIYLTGADGLLDTSYYESMMGADMGIFPSYYEPWGYTPLEGAALGTPSITTDLAGFGRFVDSLKEVPECPGVFVLKRYQKTDEQVIKDMLGIIYHFVRHPAERRIRHRIAAKNLSALADWKKFIIYYIQAHNQAVEKKYGRQDAMKSAMNSQPEQVWK